MVFLGRNSFAAAADTLVNLPQSVVTARTRLGLTAKAQATQIGIGADTLTRLEAGSVPTQTTILAILRWLA